MCTWQEVRNVTWHRSRQFQQNRSENFFPVVGSGWILCLMNNRFWLFVWLVFTGLKQDLDCLCLVGAGSGLDWNFAKQDWIWNKKIAVCAPLLAQPKQMVREEPRTTCTAITDPHQWTLDYVHFAAWTQCYMWTKVDMLQFERQYSSSKLLPLIEKCTLTFNKYVKSDCN